MGESNSSPESLVGRISAFNRAWKLAAERYGSDKPMAQGLRDMKSRLQVRLLRTYAPELVCLVPDPQLEEGGEELFGVRLLQPVCGHTDAAHLPCRVARKFLTEAEIEKFLKFDV